MKILLLTVSDQSFFPGTLAAVNSFLDHHDSSRIDYQIFVVNNEKNSLNEGQISLLNSSPHVTVVPGSEFLGKSTRREGAWQLKTYAANDLVLKHRPDVLVGFDSDLLFTSNIIPEVKHSSATGNIVGGMDGKGANYTEEYEVYGIEPGSFNASYFSSSLYIMPVASDPEFWSNILETWCKCTDEAAYGSRDSCGVRYPGHGDQGVLNAVIYARAKEDRVELLENRLWSQHGGSYERDTLTWCPINECVINQSFDQKPMRTIHGNGPCKFWHQANGIKRKRGGAGQRWAHAVFLRYLFMGAIDPKPVIDQSVITLKHHHLFKEFLFYLDLIEEIVPDFYNAWKSLPWKWVDKCLSGSQADVMLGAKELDSYASLACDTLPTKGGMLVEVGSYHGGSIVSVGIKLRHKLPLLYSVENFAAECVQEKYLRVLGLGFPYLNVNKISCDSILAANKFADNSIDMVFLDVSNETQDIIVNLRHWLPKLKKEGVIAGSMKNWSQVKLGLVEVTGGRYETFNDILWKITK